MKRLIFTILFFILANPAWANSLVPTSANNDQTGTGFANPTATYPSNNTAGDFLYAVYTADGNANVLSNVTDSAGNTWQKAIACSASCGNNDIEIWYVASCKAGANTVTFHQPNNAGNWMDIHEWKGVGNLDVTTGNSGSASTYTSGSATILNNDLVVAEIWTASATNPTAGTGFTLTHQGLSNVNADDEWGVFAAGSQAATATGPSVSYGVAMAAFKNGIHSNLIQGNSLIKGNSSIN